MDLRFTLPFLAIRGLTVVKRLPDPACVGLAESSTADLFTFVVLVAELIAARLFADSGFINWLGSLILEWQ